MSPVSCWGSSARRTGNLFDAGTYTEKRPEYAVYFQDDWRPTSKLTVNLGLRWDVYPPWVEIEDRQSNFDDHDRQVRRGVGRRVARRRQGGTLPADVFEGERRSAVRVRVRSDAATARTSIRGGFGVFWNFSPGGTSSSKAQNPPFLQSTSLTPTPTSYGVNLLLKDGLPPPPGVDPNRPAAGRDAIDLRPRLP